MWGYGTQAMGSETRARSSGPLTTTKKGMRLKRRLLSLLPIQLFRAALIPVSQDGHGGPMEPGAFRGGLQRRASAEG